MRKTFKVGLTTADYEVNTGGDKVTLTCDSKSTFSAGTESSVSGDGYSGDGTVQIQVFRTVATQSVVTFPLAAVKVRTSNMNVSKTVVA